MSERTEEEAKAFAILLGGRAVKTDRIRIYVPRSTDDASLCTDCAFLDEPNMPGTTCHVLVNDPVHDGCNGIIWVEVL